MYHMMPSIGRAGLPQKMCVADSDNFENDEMRETMFTQSLLDKKQH